MSATDNTAPVAESNGHASAAAAKPVLPARRKYTPSAQTQPESRTWHVVDAAGVPLGRLASVIAKVLLGKHKAVFTRHADAGDAVVVINAAQVVLTGRKRQQKNLYTHSGYPGGIKEEPYESLLGRRPQLAVEHAVKGMLPKNRLGRAMLKKLHVYAGAEHEQAAQKPQPLNLAAFGVKTPAAAEAATA